MIKACIFDLDGTLLDTLADLASCINGALAERGFPTHPVDAFRYFVGDGVRASVARALPEQARTDQEIDGLTARARLIFSKQGHQTTQPYPGIAAMLARLQESGLPMAVLSNKPHPMTVDAVTTFFQNIPFKTVLGTSPETPAKPNLTGADRILGLFGLKPEEVLYLGDTNTDMRTATGMGFFAVGAAWGFRPKEELLRFGAAAIIENPAELFDLPGMARIQP